MNLISNQAKDIFAETDQESVSATHNRAGNQLHAFFVYNNHLRAEGGTNSTMPIKLLNITTEEFETMTLFKYMPLPYKDERSKKCNGVKVNVLHCMIQ